MKLPIVLVDRGDVSIFESLKQLEDYVESPDVSDYQVYDADGLVIELVARGGGSKSTRRLIEVHDVTPVHAQVSEPKRYAQAELKEILKAYLKSVGRHSEGNDLATLIQQIKS